MLPCHVSVGRRWSRRDLLRLAVALPLGFYLPRYQLLAAEHRNKVKITRISAMEIQGDRSYSLIRIDTDAGLSGYGEAGVSGPVARAQIETRLKHVLLHGDPLAIEVHFHNMSTLTHAFMAHIPTISGIDIALWDLAGKILNAPVCELLGGPFRDAIPMYSRGPRGDLLDPGVCRDWAQQIKDQPEGFKAFKVNVTHVPGIGRGVNPLGAAEFGRIARAYANVREAVGDEIDIGVHCHNQFDAPGAIGIAKAVEPINPMFFEDPLSVPFSEGWMSLRRSTRVRILTGEKLELVRGFRPFLDAGAVDIVQPDLAFAGGLTGTRKIADYAALTSTPLALHNIGSLVLCYANAHFGASIHNFFRSESALGLSDRYVESMARSNPPEVRDGLLKVPEGPGLGLDLDPDFLRRNLVEGEPFWE